MPIHLSVSDLIAYLPNLTSRKICVYFQKVYSPQLGIYPFGFLFLEFEVAQAFPEGILFSEVQLFFFFN